MQSPARSKGSCKKSHEFENRYNLADGDQFIPRGGGFIGSKKWTASLAATPPAKFIILRAERFLAEGEYKNGS
ncbi:MAG: hypothetical protein ACR2N3_14060 [Pyrinomonadaceae bacterium]